jgi:MFS family permease
MHVEPVSPLPPDPISGPWYRSLTRYHWFVFAMAALGWMFDTMDQQLFVLARNPAMQHLLDTSPTDPRIDEYGGYVTMVFMMGWAIGGLGFGILGDRIGRVRTMMLTILVYSLFTGLSALSMSVWDFAGYRFLTGLGVGGEFAVGVALVAEVMPDRLRSFALGWLQALSAIGNVTAALINLALGHFQSEGILGDSAGIQAWQIMFLIGTLPALLTVLILRRLREPDRWKAVAAEEAVQKQLGSLRELFGTPALRRNAIVGMLLAFAGVVGLWGIGFFSPELIRSVLRESFQKQGLSKDEIAGALSFWVGIVSILLNLGAFFGIQVFSWFTHRSGRKPAFAIAFILALASTAFTFRYLKDFSDVFWMIPLMGFCQLSLFGGYAIYFPELFPTRLRSTGTSFCYNVGRFVAAVGPLTLGLLASQVFTGTREDRLRDAGVTMCLFFLIGLFVLPFAPETKGKPLPE